MRTVCGLEAKVYNRFRESPGTLCAFANLLDCLQPPIQETAIHVDRSQVIVPFGKAKKHRILLIDLSVSRHETPKVVSAYLHPDSKTDCALIVFSFKPRTRKYERLC